MPRIWPRYSISRLLLILLVAFAGEAGAKERAGQIRDRARKVIDNDQFQSRWPTHRPAKEDDARQGKRKPSADGSRGTSVPTRSPGSIISLMVYVFLGVLALLMVWWLFTEYEDRARQAPEVQPADSEAANAVGGVPIDSRRADELAASGAYEAAVHALLLQLIERLCEARGTLPPLSLTSRELIDVLQLRPAPDQAFRQLIAAAELIWFGGRKAEAETYTHCLALVRAAAA